MDHPRQLRLGIERCQRGSDPGRRSACRSRSRRLPVRVFERRDERAPVEHRPSSGLPPRVIVQAEEIRAGLDLGERAGQVHVAEDLIRLLCRRRQPPTRTASAPFADELDPGEVGLRSRADLPARRRAGPRVRSAAAVGVVWSSSSSSSSIGGAATSVAQERVVLFVTNRSRCPSARRSSHRSTAPGIGPPEHGGRRQRRADRGHARVRDALVRLPVRRSTSGSRVPAARGASTAKTSETRVEAIFDVESSSALSPAQKRRVSAKADRSLRAVAQDERSQLRNRELAVERSSSSCGRPEGAAPARRDEADEGRARTAPREEEAPLRQTKKLRRPPGDKGSRTAKSEPPGVVCE